MSRGYTLLCLDDLEPAPYLGSNLLPIRYELGYRVAGLNAWSADTGSQLVPPHQEDGGDEELYVVVRGRATFTVGDETGDAPAGTLIFVPPKVHRTAVAAEDGTIVLAIGATVGRPFESGAWDTFAVADAFRRAGRMDDARAVMQKAMTDLPESWTLPYNTACLEALAGNADEAFEHLRRAVAMNREGLREYIAQDSDLDGIRDDPRFAELLR